MLQDSNIMWYKRTAIVTMHSYTNVKKYATMFVNYIAQAFLRIDYFKITSNCTKEELVTVIAEFAYSIFIDNDTYKRKNALKSSKLLSYKKEWILKLNKSTHSREKRRGWNRTECRFRSDPPSCCVMGRMGGAIGSSIKEAASELCEVYW